MTAATAARATPWTAIMRVTVINRREPERGEADDQHRACGEIEQLDERGLAHALLMPGRTRR